MSTIFDFAEYISTRIPSLSPGQLALQLLSGGLTNVTVRVSFQPPIGFRSRQIHTAVLKYAPPFVAAYPTQPLSVHRQTVEARALKILSGSDTSVPQFSSLVAAFPTIRIPELIYHDDERHVLWISDLGNTRTLSKYLTSDPRPLDNEVEAIAIQLSQFITEMFRLTSASAEKDIDSSSSDPSDAGDVAQCLAQAAGKIMAEASVPDAEELSMRILRCAKGKIQDPCLGMVDFWPESILIDPEGNTGLVDWEYFGVTTAGSELGMFRMHSSNFLSMLCLSVETLLSLNTVAHLHIILLNDRLSPTSKETTRLFVRKFLQAWRTSHPTSLSLDFKYTFLISHGRELVNGVDLYSGKLSDLSKEKVTRAGVRNLRAAGATPEGVNGSFLDSASDIENDLKHFLEL